MQTVYFQTSLNEYSKKNEIKLARLELVSLLKNCINKGFSFTVSRVQLCKKEDLHRSSISIKIKSDNLLFKVLFTDDDEANFEYLTERLIFTKKIYIEENLFDTKGFILCNSNFWKKSNNRLTKTFDNNSKKALFNILNPYKGLTSFFANDMVAIDLINNKEKNIFELSEGIFADSPFTSIIYEVSSLKDLRDNLLVLKKYLPTYYSKLNSCCKFSMKDIKDKFELNFSNGLSDSLLCLIIPRNFHFLIRVYEICIKCDYLIHSYYIIDKNIYLLIRYRPISENIKNIDWEPEAFFELRRFKEVEKLRNALSGSKKFEKVFNPVYKMKSGEFFELIRPGFKDCEEYIINYSPSKFNDILEHQIKPILENDKYFLKFSKAISEIYYLKDKIEIILHKYNKTIDQINKDFSIDVESLLLFLHFAFINEDLNYRYNVHLQGKGFQTIQYTKQGRNQYYNGILDEIYRIYQKKKKGSSITSGSITGLPSHLIEINVKNYRYWFDNLMLNKLM
jgi:hypothetical protein